MTEPTTGTDLIRQALRNRNRTMNLATMTRDLGLPAGRLDDFAEDRIKLPAETLQAVVKLLWGDHIEFDVEHDALKSANRAPATSMIVPPPYVAKPLDFKPGSPIDHAPEAGEAGDGTAKEVARLARRLVSNCCRSAAGAALIGSRTAVW